MRILIADDDKVSREYLRRILSKYGLCEFSTNGIEAVDAFILAHDNKNPFDFIFLDIMMPMYDGVKALSTIRKIEKKRNIGLSNRVKVVITSALNDKELIAKLEVEGFEAYLTKPIDPESILEIVKEFKAI
jgi:two-component system, chemotaxis family, chemotaxis protein CheY